MKKLLLAIVVLVLASCTIDSYDGRYEIIYKDKFVRLFDNPIIIQNPYPYGTSKIPNKDVFCLKKYIDSNCYRLESIDERFGYDGEKFGHISFALGKKRNAKKTLKDIRDRMYNHIEEFSIGNLEFLISDKSDIFYEIYKDCYTEIYTDEEYQELVHDVVYYVKDIDSSESVYLALDMIDEMIKTIK